MLVPVQAAGYAASGERHVELAFAHTSRQLGSATNRGGSSATLQLHLQEGEYCAPLSAARTLNATGQHRVTLSPR